MLLRFFVDNLKEINMSKGFRQYNAIKNLLEKYHFFLSNKDYEKFMKELVIILEI